MRKSPRIRNIYQYLFVYGTLRKGVPCNKNDLLRKDASFIGMGKIHGELFDTGNYPAFTPSFTDTAWVTGEVYKIRKTARLFNLIDKYEEYQKFNRAPQEYARCRVHAFLEDGCQVIAWVYQYQQAVTSMKKIESGDYRLYLGQKRKHRGSKHP